MACVVHNADIRKAATSAMETLCKVLYIYQIKKLFEGKPFKSDKEPPSSVVELLLHIQSLGGRMEGHYQNLLEIWNEFQKVSYKDDIMSTWNAFCYAIQAVVNAWNPQDSVGVIPKEGKCNYFQCEYGAFSGKVYITWDKEKFGDNFCAAVSQMLQLVREERRQPTPSEYIVQHLAYLDLCLGKWGNNEKARSLGTPGFRPHTQTYISLTDPGEGHVMGTTRFTEWMDGVLVHVEYLKRPPNSLRKNIEPYRPPSMLDFSRVRQHVGSTAPTTYYMGRAVKDSGNFEEDFLKIVHITAAAAISAFFMGAAECKISMEGLSTSQAVRYMKALRVQIQPSRKQVLSAAWNLNQVLYDDYNADENLENRMDIALRAIDITSIGCFDKVTWDGACDTVPSVCIMHQLEFGEALSLVHKAHTKGLITYFSAGFQINNIKAAVFAGVDGIGIGGVLRSIDKDSGVHGPYKEEIIPHILSARDEAAKSLLGRGANLLVRLDTMYFEGSISKELNDLRQKLFKKLEKKDEHETNLLISQLKNVEDLPQEENSPFLYRAKRITTAYNPMLKGFCSSKEWEEFTRILRQQISERDEKSLMKEHDNDLWLSIRERYHKGNEASSVEEN